MDRDSSQLSHRPEGQVPAGALAEGWDCANSSGSPAETSPHEGQREVPQGEAVQPNPDGRPDHHGSGTATKHQRGHANTEPDEPEHDVHKDHHLCGARPENVSHNDDHERDPTCARQLLRSRPLELLGNPALKAWVAQGPPSAFRAEKRAAASTGPRRGVLMLNAGRVVHEVLSLDSSRHKEAQFGHAARIEALS